MICGKPELCSACFRSSLRFTDCVDRLISDNWTLALSPRTRDGHLSQAGGASMGRGDHNFAAVPGPSWRPGNGPIVG